MYNSDRYQQIIFKDDIIDIYDGIVLELRCYESFAFGELGKLTESVDTGDNVVIYDVVTKYNNSTVSSPMLCVQATNNDRIKTGKFLLKGIVHISSVTLFNSIFYSYFDKLIDPSLLTDQIKKETIFPILGSRIDKNTIFFNPINYVYNLFPIPPYEMPVPYLFYEEVPAKQCVVNTCPVSPVNPELKNISYCVDDSKFTSTLIIKQFAIHQYKYITNVLLQFFNITDPLSPIQIYSEQFNILNKNILNYYDDFDIALPLSIRMFIQDNFGFWYCCVAPPEDSGGGYDGG